MTGVLDRLPAAIKRVAPRLGAAGAEMWATAMGPPMQSSGISTPTRVAAFVGQVTIESEYFTRLEEDLNYSAGRLCEVWPSEFPDTSAAEACAMNPEALANKVYGDRMGNSEPGDGWRFRGSGLIQMTGRFNFNSFGMAIRKTAEDAADYARTPAGASASACWFWSTNRLNDFADKWMLTKLSQRINGGSGALELRINACNAALAALSQ